jgi:hypothetical protein
MLGLVHQSEVIYWFHKTNKCNYYGWNHVAAKSVVKTAVVHKRGL